MWLIENENSIFIKCLFKVALEKFTLFFGVDFANNVLKSNPKLTSFQLKIICYI